MRKYWLIAMLLVSANLFAGDSGIYFDSDRDGEGIVMTRNKNLIQIYVYTYDPWQGCPGITVPKGGLVTENTCYENRWFLTGGDTIDADDMIVTGYMYMGLGLSYPKGIVDPKDPFKSIVGEAHIVGLYVMQRFGEGWRLAVVRFGTLLPKNDPLFSQIFEFTDRLLEGTH